MQNDCNLIETDTEFIKLFYKGGNIYFQIIYDLIHSLNIMHNLLPLEVDLINNFFEIEADIAGLAGS